jgi:hypothetical protein
LIAGEVSDALAISNETIKLAIRDSKQVQALKGCGLFG